MGTVQAQLWRGSNFSIERIAAGAPGTTIFQFSGPFTARDMYNSLTPAALRELFEFPETDQAAMHIFDMTNVPYIDSMGLGMIVSHFARCNGKGIRMVLVGLSPRALQLLQLTRTDTLMPMVATVEEAAAA